MSASIRYDDADRLGQPVGRGTGEKSGTILLVAGPGVISDRLVDALCREFPLLAVEQIERPGRLLVPYACPLSLVLIDSQLLAETSEVLPALTRLHPRAQVALIEADDGRPLCALDEICRSKFIGGVLPMNVGLDAWLAVVRLMLCGGEYFPARMVRACVMEGIAVRMAAEDRSEAKISQGSHAILSGLTARENEVLERVALGLQNKAIAAELLLSENTVKIHIHNIIRKLGAHNRTEAAAAYRRL